MAEDEKTKSGDGGDFDADAALWAAATADVKPLKKQKVTEDNAVPAVSERKRPAHKPDVFSPPEKTRRRLPAGTGLDRRSDERLRRGQMDIEATLDLHGMSRQAAFEALQQFLRQGYETGRRCVLVVTGKGRGGEGVLRASVPDWLADNDICDLVLRFYPAQRRHGGGGALYVLLRRKR